MCMPQEICVHHKENTPVQTTTIVYGCKIDVIQYSVGKLWNFLFLAENIDHGYTLEPPLWDSANEYPHSIF